MKSNDESIDLKRDSRWDVWEYTPDKFHEIVSKIEFHPSVSEEVVGRFQMVKKLILHSYFEYEFLDIAFDRALMTFGMALRIRYRTIMGSESKGGSLQKVISWGATCGLFDKDEKFVQSLRRLRNFSAHPTHHSFGGYLF